MGTNTGTIMTIANSIIGVSVLAMPFCFKECGIVLSILMLILSSILSRLTCYLLLKAAVMARRRNFEFLAFHIFGPTGKFVAELCIIGFLVGTCIAFFVVVGDLGPAIISTTLDVANSATLRTSVLIGLAVVVVLPLGLLRNVDSLSSVCTATIGFYMCLVLKVVGEALPHLASGDWTEHVNLWRPAGILQCLPIFSMALFCQTQLFEIYDSLPNPSLERMNGAVRTAINLCTCVYISVGFFGYVAFCTESFGGNILMSFKPTLMSDVIKLGFVLSVAVSFPLVIFPCRASLYSLLFRRQATIPHHETIKTFIPETKFKCITIFVIVVPLAIGLVIPNIELVLGLVGSTIGVGICVIFPAMAFIFVSTKDTADRVIAQFLLFCGVLILVLGTYATLYAANENPNPVAPPGDAGVLSFLPPAVENVVDRVHVKLPQSVEKMVAENVAEVPKMISPKAVVSEASIEVKEKEVARQEPPQPVEPAADKKPDVVAVPEKKSGEVLAEKFKENSKESVGKVSKDVNVGGEVKVRGKVEEVIDKDALEKEDDELADAEKQAVAASDQKHEEVLRKIEKQDEERNKLIQEQNKILKEILKEKIIENDKKKDELPVAPKKETIETVPINKKVDAVKVSDEQQKLIQENEIIKQVLLQEQKKIVKQEKANRQDEKVQSPVPMNSNFQENPAGLEIKKILEDVPNIVNVIPKKLPAPVPDLVKSAYIEDNKPVNNLVPAKLPIQPIAYQQRFVSNDNEIQPNNPAPQQNLGQPFENINDNKHLSIKSLIMDGQNVKDPSQNSINNDVVNLPVQDNAAVIHNQVIPELSNELDKIKYVDVLKKNVAEPVDEAKAMRRDILETDEGRSGRDREKREAKLEEMDDGSEKTGDISLLGEVSEMQQELHKSKAKDCEANEKANVATEVVPLTSLKDPETRVEESLIKVSAHLMEPVVDMGKDQNGPDAGSQFDSLLNGAVSMKRDLKSVGSQPTQDNKINESEANGAEM